MTLQEIYNKVKTHLLTQNQKSMQGNLCLYRHPQGLKCAVGCLIYDLDYSPDFEGISVRAGVQEERFVVPEHQPFRKYLQSHFSPEELRLLEDLQAVHDGSPPEEWFFHLRVVAEKRGLTP